jgi:ferric-dicitrate binding protein FerR (iron transport regulator)
VVEAAQHKSSGGASRWALAAIAVVLLGAAGTFYAFHARPQAVVSARRVSQGERIVADARPTDFTLPDGTSLALSPASSVTVLQTSDQGSMRLRVERGRVRFDVPYREGHGFVVEARDVRAVGRGTRFLVEVKQSAVGSEIQIGVERGRVEVQDRKGRVMSALHPNQSWSMQLPPLTQPAAPSTP